MFKITIEKTETKVVIRRGDWVTTANRFPTQKEFDDSMYQGFNAGNNIGEADKKAIKESIANKEMIVFKEYGYTPEREVEETTDIKIFEQVVEELDLKEVVAAVNKMRIKDTE